MFKKLFMVMIVLSMLVAAPVYADKLVDEKGNELVVPDGMEEIVESFAEGITTNTNNIRKNYQHITENRIYIKENRNAIIKLQKELSTAGEMIGIIYGYLYLVQSDPDNAKYYFEKMDILMRNEYGFGVKALQKK